MKPKIDPEFSAAIQPLAPDEASQLEANILQFGCRDPLVVWRGLLVDGHHRLEICTRHGLAYQVVEIELPNREAALDWIDANQLGRRNLTQDEFRYLVGRRYKRAKKAAHGRSDREFSGDQSDPPKSTAQTLAAEYGVGEATVKRAGKFAEEIDATPELKEALTKKEPIQRAKRKMRDKQAEVKRATEAKAQAAAAPIKLIVDIRHGDFREVLADLRDVDAVICDPPYPREFLPLLDDLAAWADLVLKPDGVLAVLFGQTYLPEVYRRLSGGRPYRWTACYVTPGAGYASHQAAVQSNWKPLLIYGGGKRFGDVIRSDGDDKQHHKWGQNYSAFREIIERLTNPGDTVVDPFAGGGTTLLAAHSLGRHAIGCDIEQDAVDATKARFS